MATLPINLLRSKYEEYTNNILNDVNTGYITLFYPIINALTPNSSSFTDRPMNMDSYGGRVPIDSMTDRASESGTNTYEHPTSETLKARVYWQIKKIDGEGNIINRPDICKVIISSASGTSLNNATKASIDGRTCKMMYSPTTHGLFGKQWTTSFWEVIDDNKNI